MAMCIQQQFVKYFVHSRVHTRILFKEVVFDTIY